MKVDILSVSMLTALFSLAGCTKPSAEIVESDYRYTLDENVISVEMPKKFAHNPSNLVASTTMDEVFINVNEDTLQDGSNEFPFQVNVKLKRPLEAPLKVMFKPDAGQTIAYKTTLGDKYTELTDGVIDGLEFEIPKGVSSFVANMKLHNAPEILKAGKNLCGVYSLSLVSEQDGVMISKHSADLFVKISLAKTRLTIIPGSTVPSNWKLMDHSKIQASSNYNSGRVRLVVDGSVSSGNWWVPSQELDGGDSYLALFFDDAKVVGFKIIQNNPPKTFKSFDLGYSKDSGKSVYEWGNISDSESNHTELIVQINEPEYINLLFLYNVMSHKPGSDSYIDIHEIEVYTIE